ncbi:MAG: lipopolysaccharide biosynthesis protein, partial [Tannerellaceae bacterium]
MTISKGIFWSFIDRGAAKLMQFIITIFIARLVAPADYGLIALTTVFLTIAQVFIDCGFTEALLRKQEIKEIDYSTVFVYNIVVSIILYVAIFYSSTFVANYYQQPALGDILRILALTLLINAAVIVQRTKLTKSLDFKTQAKASIISLFIASLLSLILAVNNYGVWAIVVYNITYCLFNALIIIVLVRWSFSVRFSQHSFFDLFGFSSKLLISQLIDVLCKNIVSLIIGKCFNTTSLGYYNRSYMFTSYPIDNIVALSTRVLYPTWSDITNEVDLLSSFYRSLINLTIVVSFVLSFVYFNSEAIIRVCLNDSWLNMTPILQIITLSFILYPLSVLNDNILKVKGRSDLFLLCEIVKKTIYVVSILATFSYGLYPLVWGLVIVSLIGALINSIAVASIVD